MLDDALARRAALCGVATGYHDYTGKWIEPPRHTVEALVDLLGSAPEDVPAHHQGPCYVDDGMRCWGWAAQLYALRSRSSWGIGDFSDLGTLTAWSEPRGGTVMLSPLNAGSPVSPLTDSPYYPSSRMRLDPIHLDVTRVPGWDRSPALDDALHRGLVLNEGPIDRDAVWRAKSDALDELWAGFDEDRRFTAFRDEDPALDSYATFCALAEFFGPRWTAWPAELRSPDGEAVREFGRARSDRVSFHAWLQWLCDEQLAAASGSRIADLAVGIDPRGADAWMLGDQVLRGATIGAPPDEFNTQGQDWSLATFHPHRMVASEGKAFIATIRAGMRHASGLRVDHVMGMFRLYLIPDGASPTEGTYVAFPHKHLLGWVASESQARRCFVIGEDLGTVEPRVGKHMERLRMLSYRVMLFDEDPSTYPPMSVGSATTHDLPTIAGLITGSDLADQSRLGLQPNAAAMLEVRSRFVDLAGSEDPAEVALALYARLARSPSMVVLATFQDALGITERPNMPGTLDEWSNWRLALDRPLEEVLSAGSVTDLVDVLSDRGPKPR